MPRRHNGKPYKGINILILWAESIARGYTAPIWMTYRQAMELGANIREGEPGTTVVYGDRIVRKEMDNDAAETRRAIPFLKAYTDSQIDNLPSSTCRSLRRSRANSS